MTEAVARPNNAATLLFFAGAVIALSHLANEWVKLEQPLGPTWKAAGIIVLGLYALSQRAWLAGWGLLLSSAGDVLLELNGLFVFGMAAFGAAHVCYGLAFVNLIRRDGPNIGAWPLAMGVLGISIVLGVWLAPGMEALTAPALIYQLIISLMVMIALLSKAPLAARIGAVLFMLSDTLIAVGMFRGVAVPAGSVWITYAAAQIMLAWGLTRPAEA
ncbi:MAG TPA: lysoplasmalogenase [Hyphomonadaceae bacterium]|nr:lysoplasmalogenase [Hyphomonadaceae bacterium]